MNKRLIAVGVALVLVVLVVVLNVVFKKSPASSGDICQNFITAIQKGDAKKSYGMLSQKGKDSSSLSDWGKQVDILKVDYVDGTVTKVSSDDAGAVTAAKPQTREILSVKSGGATYHATCFITESEIDAFTSQPVYGNGN